MPAAGGRLRRTPGSPLTRCPACGYSLEGLPPAHRCPECGLEYDEHSRVWRPRKSWRAYVAFVGGPGVVVVMLWNAVVPIVLVRVSLQEALLRVGLILAATAVAVVWLQVAYKRGRLAAFVPVGVYIRVRTRVERIPWAKVEKARLNGRDAEILWRGRLMPLLLFGFFEDKQEAEAFCEAVMEARKHYSKPADGEAA